MSNVIIRPFWIRLSALVAASVGGAERLRSFEDTMLISELVQERSDTVKGEGECIH